MIQLKDIPENYEYCFESTDNCPKADTCLRALAAQAVLQSGKAKTPFVTCVHPCYTRRHAADGTCTHYRTSTPQRRAKGMTKLFEELPLKIAATVKERVIDSFSSRTVFYQCRNGERLITPEEQARIARIFRAAGIQYAPQFDEYEDTVVW